MTHDLLERTKEEIKTFLASIGPVPADEIDEESSLEDQGVVDSLGLTKFQLFIEHRLGREISPDEVTDDTLLTVRAAAEWLVPRLRDSVA